MIISLLASLILICIGSFLLNLTKDQQTNPWLAVTRFGGVLSIMVLSWWIEYQGRIP